MLTTVVRVGLLLLAIFFLSFGTWQKKYTAGDKVFWSKSFRGLICYRFVIFLGDVFLHI